MDLDPPDHQRRASRRGGHERDDSRGELLPTPPPLPRTTRRPTVRAVSSNNHPRGAAAASNARRSRSGRVPSSAYAEKHRAQFSATAAESSRSPSQSTRTRSSREQEDKIKKRRGRRRRTTLDHNHYQDGDPRRGPAYIADPEKAAAFSDDSKRRKRRRISEQDTARREPSKRRRKRLWIVIAVVATILLIIIIAVAATVAHRHSSSNNDSPSPSTPTEKPANPNLSGIDPNSIPASAKGTYYDPFSWYDTADFNLTYTDETVGGLPIMGLNSSYSDNARANSLVPPLSSPFPYGDTPIRGMNVGGWLSLEPFITPSFFSPSNSDSPTIIDEYTLTKSLGEKAAPTLEAHYATFVTRSTFADIRAAGFDHVRISYSYWAVTTFPGDPYVEMISFRYLLRAIEYCRSNGLRVNLDLHGAPGSQNGWNHSGRQGPIGWLNGTDGQLNADRTLDVHRQLTAFFAQPRYANVVTMYGIVNEPRMAALDQDAVLNWTTQAIAVLRQSGMPQSTVAVIGDGFLGLANWHGSSLLSLPNTTASNLLLDAHQYAIFALDQLALPHAKKLAYVCDGFAQQTNASMDPARGFGNFVCGEWSQADTDCAPNLNNVGSGSRWEGSYLPNERPGCAAHDASCSCARANGDPAAYTDAYRRWLRAFAAGQLQSFSYGWGSFYWTWQTEQAVQWSWRRGAAAGILPADVRALEAGACSSTDLLTTDWVGQGLGEGW